MDGLVIEELLPERPGREPLGRLFLDESQVGVYRSIAERDELIKQIEAEQLALAE